MEHGKWGNAGRKHGRDPEKWKAWWARAKADWPSQTEAER